MSNDRVVVGKRAVEEVLRHNRDEIIELLTTSKQVIDPKLIGSIPCRVVERAELDRLYPEVRHQGFVAKLKPAKEVSLKELLSRANKEGSNALVVAIDQVSDPQNLGSILRVSECAGVVGIIIPERNSAPISPTVRKISAGASEILPVVRVTNLRRALEDCKKAGLWIVGSSCEEGTQEIYDAKVPFPCVLVLGSEGEGMRALTSKECDVLVRLPVFGKLSSLNVSQAASILLYELRRQMKIDSRK